jgi:hypothetical protein
MLNATTDDHGGEGGVVISPPWGREDPVSAAFRELEETRAAAAAANDGDVIDLNVFTELGFAFARALGRYEEACRTAGVDPGEACPELRQPPVQIERRTAPVGSDLFGGEAGWVAVEPYRVPALRRDTLLAKLQYGPEQVPGVYLAHHTDLGDVYALVTLAVDGVWFGYKAAVEIVVEVPR